MVRTVVKLTNSLINIIIGLAILLAGCYSAYCLWDNQQIYSAADHVQAELLILKPKAKVAEQGGPTFDELLAINPDVCAWVTMDGTKIDYPVLHGETNMDYINTDVYGNFAMAGSIFLDFRNSSDFTDFYSVLYGHHMEKSAMFGDLDKYLEQKFFDENVSGELMIQGKCYALDVIACTQVRASEERIFDPETWIDNFSGLMDYVKTQSIHYHPETVDSLLADTGAPKQILALTTCSSAFTDARTVVLTVMSEITQEEGSDFKQ